LLKINTTVKLMLAVTLSVAALAEPLGAATTAFYEGTAGNDTMYGTQSDDVI
jgi:hypothetical protein